MVRPEKAATVQELREKFARSRTVVVLGFQGIPGEEMTALRRMVRTRGWSSRW